MNYGTRSLAVSQLTSIDQPTTKLKPQLLTIIIGNHKTPERGTSVKDVLLIINL